MAFAEFCLPTRAMEAAQPTKRGAADHDPVFVRPLTVAVTSAQDEDPDLVVLQRRRVETAFTKPSLDNGTRPR